MSERLRILLVEDEFLACLEIEDLLRHLGCVVVGPAARLAEALPLAREAELDGALVDLNLAGEPAYPVIEALAERAVPYVLVTGYDDSGIAPAYRDAPRIAKPFGETAVRSAVAGFRSQWPDHQPPRGEPGSAGS